jgi:hypothetical protein
VEFLAAGFGLTADAGRSKTRCLYELTEVMAKRHQARHMSALIVDEAQVLPDVLLEEIRLPRQYRVGVREAAVNHPRGAARVCRSTEPVVAAAV